ncbi:MAG: energy transducer TonB [Terracidiphilus sp.]|nr:energy transducer TonB [Terracidiphilus sp.]MDR3796573.1 energy transducer TonB [Terracidiphilus sp.]
MRASSVLFILFAILPSTTSAQTQPKSHAVRPEIELNISSGVAEKLLIHKAELQCPKIAMPPRITGTVVVAFTLDRGGNVRNPTVISGPALLRKPVLDAVRQYKYKPYLLNGKAVEVETTVSVAVDTARDCPNW